MLLELSVQNVALIVSLRLSLQPGLSVLTGETGAGKSILIDALSLVLGGRADRGLVRTGAEKAVAEALFDITSSPAATELLNEWGIDTSEGTVALTRELTASGRSTCRISGSLATAAQFKSLCALLVDLHGQHEHQRLLNRAAHRAWVDDFAGAPLLSLRDECANAYDAWRGIQREIDALGGSEQDRERRADTLRYQIDEIEDARIKPGEGERLAVQRNRLRHAERIATQVAQAWDCLWEGSGRSASARDSLAKAASALSSIAELDETIAAAAQRVAEVRYALEDAADEVRALLSFTEAEPDELERVEQRLELLSRLRKKYGQTSEDVLAYLVRAQEELSALEHSAETLEALYRRRDAAYTALTGLCGRLSIMRTEAGTRMAALTQAALAELGMGKTRFEVVLAQGTPERLGWDDVAFFIAPNPGEPLKPLADIASGGEMSRVMLALKAIGAQQGDVGTLIFDEIDTGVSGRIAQAVAEKLADIAATRQVLCVTHLPQIAAMGATHYRVEKAETNGRTETRVALLDDSERIAELARIVGGLDAVDDTAVQHARNILAAGKRYAAIKRKNREV